MTALLFALAVGTLIVLMTSIGKRRRERIQRAKARDEELRRRRYNERAAADRLYPRSERNVTALSNGRPPVEEHTP